MLFRRGVVATKYCDIDALKTLRIEEDVRWLFDNIGLGNLLTTKTPTSTRATLELLSSLKVHMFPNPSSGGSSITFRLFNEDHTWTLEKLNEALGIPIGGPRVTPQHWNEKELWRTISVELDYDSKRSFVTCIRHPALRYVFKVFSNTIFGRQEGSKVRKDEIFMLHHMLHATPIDTGAFFIHQLQSTANNVNTGGKIVQGGFITRIATYLGHREQLIRDGFIDGTDAVEVPPSWFKKKDGTTLWRIQNDEDEIPSPEQLTLRNRANWSFNYSSRSVHVPLLPEPSMSSLPLPYDGDPSSPSPTTSSCASFQNSIDEIMVNQRVIMADQKVIKDELASISSILTSLGPWLQSQGFSHPSLPPP
ncbi:DNA-directed RNA polymerase subunit beta [Bienertia sinuspersici]